MTRPDERDDLRPQGDPVGYGQGGGKPDRSGRAALLLGFSGVALSVIFFPLGLVLDVAAIVVGVRALRRARQRHGKAPGALAGVISGSLGACLVVVVVTVLAFFWQEVRAYQECMSGANTIRSQEKCMRQFENAIEERFGITA